MTDLHSALKAVKHGWNRPHWWIRQFNSQIVGRYYRHLVGNDGVHVMSQDWDTLVILDGCRYDLYQNTVSGQSNFNGDLQQRRSLGCESTGFLRENFAGGNFPDTVYVTANPFVKTVLDDPFYHVDHVWIDGWDKTNETVLPETMVERAVEQYNRFPNKRMIVHFMQPHHPFIGKHRIKENRGYIGARTKAMGDDAPRRRFVWERLRAGEISEDELWTAYRDNLIRALESVEEFTSTLTGKTVITSDHGNAFGERARPFPTRVYGHARDVRIPALADVPWHELPYDERREVFEQKETSTDALATDETTIKDRLEALGYT